MGHALHHRIHVLVIGVAVNLLGACSKMATTSDNASSKETSSCPGDSMSKP